ncbi:MAG: aminotransferase class I/II-fold pyridoxal phosphate-dependent enzyme [Clostridium fessum]
MIVDLSIGAPNIAPAPHILKALSEACLVPEKLPVCNSGSAGTSGGSVRLVCAPLWSGAEPGDRDLLFARFQEGLAHIALSIVDEGDVVLVPDPCYPVFADGPSLAGAELYYMPQREENHYIIDLKEIPRKSLRKRNL